MLAGGSGRPRLHVMHHKENLQGDELLQDRIHRRLMTILQATIKVGDLKWTPKSGQPHVTRRKAVNSELPSCKGHTLLLSLRRSSASLGLPLRS